MSDEPQRMVFEDRDAGGSIMWRDFESELLALDDSRPLLLSPRQLRRMQFNIRFLRAALKEKLLVGAPHSGPEQCPTYYDGCNCTVEALEYALQTNDELRRRLKASGATE